MVERRRWLILSHGFNMDGRAASQTITDKLPHLMARGVQPVVLSAVTGQRDSRFPHQQILPVGPVGLRFDLRHKLQRHWGKDWRYRATMLAATLALLPGIVLEKALFPLQSQWSWWWPAYRRGLALIRRGEIDLIYSTGGAYSAHVAAHALKQVTGLPWMAEVHDPLVPPGSVPRSREELEQARVEGLIARHADIPFWFTEQALASARRRHPLMAGRGRMLLPGADAPQAPLPAYQRGGKLVLGHFGSLSPTRHLGGVIEALSRLDETARSEIELHVYGSGLDVHTEQARQRWPAVSLVHHGRVERDPLSGKSGRQRVLEAMRQCDVLLLHHGVEPVCAEYIPSKLYEYLWMQRPILGLTYRNAQLDAMLAQTGHRAVPADSVGEQAQALNSLWQAWREGGLADQPQHSPFTTAAAVDQLLAWVEAL